jgi:hypothetical protein
MAKIAELEQDLADVQARIKELLQLNHELLGEMAPLEHDESARLDPEKIARLASLRHALEAARQERIRLEDERLPEARQRLAEAQEERQRLAHNIQHDAAFWSRYYPHERALVELSARLAEIATATGSDELNEMRRQLFGLSVRVRQHRTGLEAAQKRLENL